MAKQKATGLTPSCLEPPKPSPDLRTDPEKPVAMTLKLSHGLYVRQLNLAATKKSKGQAIMLQAVAEYLSRVGG